MPDEATWVRWIVDSHVALVGRALIPSPADGDLTRALDTADVVVLAHDGDTGPDGPRLVYANRLACTLWERPRVDMVGMPSRLTAEPDARVDREALLAEAARRGWSDGYRGVRVSASGRRFEIVDARLWTVSDAAGRPVGQAATFAAWRHL